MKRFFSWAEENLIINSIRNAERLNESEIRVHVDYDLSNIDIMDAAIKTFHKLGMHKTKHRNGVLIFILPERKQFAVIGDIGIHEKVKNTFWEKINKLLQEYYTDSRFVYGTCEAISLIGQELTMYFPINNNHNELPDHISYG